MDILIVSPSLEPYGGVRVILNLAKYLQWAGHKVTLQSINGAMSCPWFNLPDEVQLRYGWPDDISAYTLVIATNPDTVFFCYGKRKTGLIYLCQMAEEFFFEKSNTEARNKAVAAAGLPIPMITVADWVKYHYGKMDSRHNAPIYVVPNGVDIEFINSEPKQRTDKTVFIVEGLNSNNEAKDTFGLLRFAVKMIKAKWKEDVFITGFGQTEPREGDKRFFSEYVVKPTTLQLSGMYSRANFLLKASMYETRSLAPLEAIACGCIPIVAIKQGHPDLVHLYNSFVADYAQFNNIGQTPFFKAIDAAMETSYEERISIRLNGRRIVLSSEHVVKHIVQPILKYIANV